jgi:3-isopropylmalate/(R)-2-methylmalate dehydratase large subunit
VVAASAIAGYIATSDKIPDSPSLFTSSKKAENTEKRYPDPDTAQSREEILEGKVWIINKDNIDTDMIFHNRYLAITDIREMGQYTFDNLKGYEDFSKKAGKGDILISGKNFGCGSSRQQAVDCFVSLGIQAVIAESFGVIYERNAINAAFPVISAPSLDDMNIKDGDHIKLNLKTGEIVNLQTYEVYRAAPFSDVQLKVYRRGGLLRK